MVRVVDRSDRKWGAVSTATLDWPLGTKNAGGRLSCSERAASVARPGRVLPCSYWVIAAGVTSSIRASSTLRSRAYSRARVSLLPSKSACAVARSASAFIGRPSPPRCLPPGASVCASVRARAPRRRWPVGQPGPGHGLPEAVSIGDPDVLDAHPAADPPVLGLTGGLEPDRPQAVLERAVVADHPGPRLHAVEVVEAVEVEAELVLRLGSPAGGPRRTGRTPRGRHARTAPACGCSSGGRRPRGAGSCPP